MILENFGGADMNQWWLDNPLKPLQLGEALIQGSVEGLHRGWQASSAVIGKLCTGTERWHAALKQIQAPMNLADILRARAVLPPAEAQDFTAVDAAGA